MRVKQQPPWTSFKAKQTSIIHRFTDSYKICFEQHQLRFPNSWFKAEDYFTVQNVSLSRRINKGISEWEETIFNFDKLYRIYLWHFTALNINILHTTHSWWWLVRTIVHAYVLTYSAIISELTAQCSSTRRQTVLSPRGSSDARTAKKIDKPLTFGSSSSNIQQTTQMSLAIRGCFTTRKFSFSSV
jgi:hypothetical protein